MKVMPTMIMAAAMRPSISRIDLESRVAALVQTLGAAGANLSSANPREIVEQAARSFDLRGVVVEEDGRYRVRERTVLRYYARAIEHLLPTPASRTH
jgi:hypothetical protein